MDFPPGAVQPGWVAAIEGLAEPRPIQIEGVQVAGKPIDRVWFLATVDGRTAEAKVTFGPGTAASPLRISNDGGDHDRRYRCGRTAVAPRRGTVRDAAGQGAALAGRRAGEGRQGMGWAGPLRGHVADRQVDRAADRQGTGLCRVAPGLRVFRPRPRRHGRGRSFATGQAELPLPAQPYPDRDYRQRGTPLRSRHPRRCRAPLDRDRRAVPPAARPGGPGLRHPPVPHGSRPAPRHPGRHHALDALVRV